MCINPIPPNIPQSVRDDYWNSIIHLYELGLIDTTKTDNEVFITPQGRACLVQMRYLENKNRRK